MASSKNKMNAHIYGFWMHKKNNCWAKRKWGEIKIIFVDIDSIINYFKVFRLIK